MQNGIKLEKGDRSLIRTLMKMICVGDKIIIQYDLPYGRSPYPSNHTELESIVTVSDITKSEIRVGNPIMYLRLKVFKNRSNSNQRSEGFYLLNGQLRYKIILHYARR